MIMRLKSGLRKIIVGMCMLIALLMLLAGCDKQEAGNSDTVQYEGDYYVFLEYPTNIFYYDYNGNSNENFEEVDGIYPIESPKWSMIWNGGDIYGVKDSVDEAKSYYANDDNYDWYVVIDTEEGEEILHPINITETERDSVYDLEEMERTTSVFMEEFEAHGSILKISKDGIVRGTISIAKYDGNWYWKSEIIDESREADGIWPEWVQPLPETLDSKIKEAE